MARWPSLPNERGDTRWGLRSRLIISKSFPSHFLLFVFVYEFSFNSHCFLLTIFFVFPNGFADKNTVVSNFSLVNQPSLDKILKVEVLIHSDNQLRTAYLILGYTPISTSFQASKCVIKAKDPCLYRISVVVLGFSLPTLSQKATQSNPATAVYNRRGHLFSFCCQGRGRGRGRGRVKRRRRGS